MTDVDVGSLTTGGEARDETPKPSAVERITGLLDSLAGPARFLAAILGALVVFGILIAIKGVNPLQAYSDMLTNTFGSVDSIGDIAIRTAPILLAALAVTVPARAGLINVGGEGQLIMGGIGAVWMSQTLDGSLPGGLTLVLMGISGAVAGALWAGIAGALRSTVKISESVTTLLLNYVALDLLYFLIYDPWKNKQGSGQPATVPLPASEHLPLFGDSRVHAGILIAVIATLLVYAAFTWTSWGFRLRVVGGNAEAARRAGMRITMLTGGAMLIGGALAGIGGFVQLTGAEFTLRPGFCATYGYVGFLASWLARHKPLGVAVAAFALSAIAISGDSLQLDSGLPAASVNVLMAVVLLFVFGFGRRTAKSGVAT
jgi:simple sugar transport system permease protein